MKIWLQREDNHGDQYHIIPATALGRRRKNGRPIGRLIRRHDDPTLYSCDWALAGFLSRRLPPDIPQYRTKDQWMESAGMIDRWQRILELVPGRKQSRKQGG